MADLTHFFNSDVTARTTTSETLAEETNYTTSWSDLTTAGFSNGSDVLIAIRYVASTGVNGIEPVSEIRIGSTFGVAAAAANRHEVFGTSNQNIEYIWIDRVTLSTNDNIYIGTATETNPNTASFDDFCIMILSLDDLQADDFRFNENTTLLTDMTSGEGEQDGASVTLPSGGGDDWLILSSLQIDGGGYSATGSINYKLSLGGSNFMNTLYAGSPEDAYHMGMTGQLRAAGSSAVCKVVVDGRDASGDTDHVRSAIFALRLEAFTDFTPGNMDSDNITQSGTTNTYVETNTSDLVLSTTGNVAFFASTLGDGQASVTQQYHRVQADDADFIASLGNGIIGQRWNTTTPVLPMSSWGVKSLTSGTITIDVDTADNDQVSYDMIDHNLVAFSLDLVSAVSDTAIEVPLGPVW